MNLAAITTNNLDNDVDGLSWTIIDTSSFSVKTTHAIQTEWNRRWSWIGWIVIWSLKVPERVRTFMWRAAHDNLLTFTTRCRRGLS